MIKAEFIRPGRGVHIPADPTNPDFLGHRAEIAATVRNKMSRGELLVLDLASIVEITPVMLGDDDTAWPRGPAGIRNHEEIIEVELDKQFSRYLDDGTALPGEPIVMPVHASSIIFSARHDRSDDWYSTGIITCEDEALLAGEAAHPFFVWIEHQF